MLRKRAAIYNAESNNLEVRSMHLHLEARYMDTLAYGLEREISTLKNRRLKPRF